MKYTSAARAPSAEPWQPAIAQSLAELMMAKRFLHEAGTDPDAWIDSVLDRLRGLLSAPPSAARPER